MKSHDSQKIKKHNAKTSHIRDSYSYIFYCETSDLDSDLDFCYFFFSFPKIKTQCKDEPLKRFLFSGIVHYDGLTIATVRWLVAFVGMVAVCATVTPAPAVVTASSVARPAARC